MNRLASEPSPYLQQHAGNPVDWHPWGHAAFAIAKDQNKPVLLSIGYAACHWCHVMEHESFAVAETAAVMNENFVCVKVDREERPDVDSFYQLAIQATGRTGGWPLTVFLLPDTRVFFVGTYFPPSDKFGLPAFPRLLRSLSEAWAQRKDDILAHAAEFSEAMNARTAGKRVQSAYIFSAGQDESTAFLRSATATILKRVDAVHGGFGNAPKFPNLMALEVLAVAGVQGDESAKAALLHAVDSLVNGGIYDQLGGGLHRYSTDAAWLVPHFEKMLYDNATWLRLLALVHTSFAHHGCEAAIRETVSWLAREMRHTSGAFFSSQDADTDGHEGKFFVWSPEHIDAALAARGAGPISAALENGASPSRLAAAQSLAFAAAAFGVVRGGNFEGGPSSVLTRALSSAELATRFFPGAAAGVAGAEAERETLRAVLFSARQQRVAPPIDDKLLASWNGLAMGALARCGHALGDSSMVNLAKQCADCILLLLCSEDTRGRLVNRFFRDGHVRGPGFLDDYAFVADGLLDVYRATGEERFLTEAHQIASSLWARFHDGDEAESLVLRSSEARDGESIPALRESADPMLPSANAVAARVFRRIGALVDEAFLARAETTLVHLRDRAVKEALFHAQTVVELTRVFAGPPSVLVLVGDSTHDAFSALLAAANESPFDAFEMVRWSGNGACAAAVAAASKPKGERPRAYLCRGTHCLPPSEDAASLRDALAAPV